MNGRSENEASLFFQNGELIHARAEQKEGLEALEYVLSRQNSYFNFISNLKPPRKTIGKPVNFLILDLQNRLDELKDLQSKLPPDECRAFLKTDMASVPAISPQEWKVISYINGKRTIKRICQKTDDELGTKKIIADLIHKGLVTILSTASDWYMLTPISIPSERVTGERPYPPLLRTNLLLKHIDGNTHLGQLAEALKIKDTDIIDDIKVLHETRWITFSPRDTHVFNNLKAEH